VVGAVQTAANIAEQAMTGASNSIIADVMAADAVLMQTVNNWQANQALALTTGKNGGQGRRKIAPDKPTPPGRLRTCARGATSNHRRGRLYRRR
jgi:hypothetical protein